MEPGFDGYLRELDEALRSLPPEERLDAVREISSHIEDATRAGTPPHAIRARLGSPRSLAMALVADRVVQSSQPLPHGIVRIAIAGAFLAGSSLTSLVMVPFLTVVAVSFGLVGVSSPFLGLARTLGATWIHIDLGPAGELPAVWSIPFTIVLGLLLVGVARLAYLGLRLYLRLLARGYRTVLTPG